MKMKVCPICGKEFPCYADDEGRACWCELLPKIDIEEVSDCLCPDCLKNKALGQDDFPRTDSSPN